VAEQRHTTAFVVGALIGGVAGAAVVYWRTPKSGQEVRTELTAAVESALLRATEVGERGREKIVAMAPISTKEPASASADTPVGDIQTPSPAEEPVATGPEVFPPLVDFAPPGVDVESPTESTS
jgi:hypothetical protein